MQGMTTQEQEEPAVDTSARAGWVPHPYSYTIAGELNASGARLCKHDRNPCYLRCGVVWEYMTETWYPIPEAVRRKWAEDIFAPDPVP
jgi:hypothetical protein